MNRNTIDKKLQFYSAWFCPFAQRAWIGLVHKNIDFDYHEVNPYKKTKEWLKINPNGLVPAFSHRGKTICESSICLEFLEDSYPGTTRIFPDDPQECAKQRRWGDQIDKEVGPVFYSLLATTRGSSEAAELLSALKLIFDDADVTGPFLGGQQLQYADIMLAPFALRFKPILGPYKGFEVPKDWERFHKWYAAISEHPSIIPTMAGESKMVQMFEQTNIC